MLRDNSDGDFGGLGNLHSKYLTGGYHDEIPQEIGEYAIDVNNPILVRWEADDELVECSLAANMWSARVKKNGKFHVLMKSEKLGESISALTEYMKARSGIIDDEFEGSGMASQEIVDEVNEVLDEVNIDGIKDVFG